jgi:hypothetical protein
LRDCLSGEILLARSLLSSTAKDLADLITDTDPGKFMPSSLHTQHCRYS